MRSLLACTLLLIGGVISPATTLADDEIIVEEVHRGIPVQNAILTRRYGAVETEDEVVQQEFEAGYGASDLFKSVHWRRVYRPYGWYGGYRGFGYGYGYGVYGPRYYAGYRPRYMSYYPTYGYGYGAPYWGGYGGYGYGGYYGAMPYTTFYAPPVIYGGYGGFGGCYYW